MYATSLTHFLQQSQGVACPRCILYLRFHPLTPSEPAELIQDLLREDKGRLDGFFLVLNRNSVRRRPLPTL
jgi:hypothetical protein